MRSDGEVYAQVKICGWCGRRLSWFFGGKLCKPCRELKGTKHPTVAQRAKAYKYMERLPKDIKHAVGGGGWWQR